MQSRLSRLIRRHTSARLNHTLAYTNHSRSNSNESHASIVILHGIMGSRLNFRTMANKIARSYPNADVITMDLPGHGDSTGDVKASTVKDCADAVEETCQSIGVSEPTIVVGHSFGGKVALKMYERQRDTSSEKKTSAFWILDSTPGTINKDDLNVSDPNSVAGVIESCRSLKTPFAGKDELMKSLGDLGVAPGIQQWMTTNIKRQGEHYVWRFDLNIIQDLFENYGHENMWPVMSVPPSNVTSLHLVRASRNRAWKKKSIVEKVNHAVQCGGLNVHDIDAGHWLHAEKPQEVFDLMDEYSFRELLV